MSALCVHDVAEMVRRCALVITYPPRVKLFTDALPIARRSRKGATQTRLASWPDVAMARTTSGEALIGLLSCWPHFYILHAGRRVSEG